MPAPLNTRKQKITFDPRALAQVRRGRRRDDPPNDPLRHRGRWRISGEPDEQAPEEPQPEGD